MPQLIVEQPGAAPLTAPISAQEMRLGRAEDNDIVLSAEEVSRHHAKLCRRGEQMVLIDLNSLNGTYVNRQRIAERVLNHMDEIWFGGQCRLVFRDDTAFGREKKEKDSDSTLLRDLDKIRAEMTRVGDSLTMIGRKGRTPVREEEGVPEAATPQNLVAMSRAYRRLDALYQASKLIAADFDLENRLAKVLDTVLEVLDADRGFVMIRDDKSNALQVTVAREMGRDLDASSPSMGIAGRAAIDGEPVLMTNAAQDMEFGVRDSIVRQRIKSAMCVPLRVEDRILGSIYIDTRRPDVSFSEEDLELFASLAAQSAMAIDNVRLHEQVVETEKKRANLGRFLSPAVVNEIMGQESELGLGGQKRVVTTLFCDIRGFTPIAERLSPNELVDLLNGHFTAMTDIIFDHEGTLDKYNGDEVMALFGAPLSERDDAERAVRAALDMQAANAELNKTRVEEGLPTFEVGIGIETGDVIAGYVGSPKRLDFTVIGDRVNTARRLCSLAAGGQVVAGTATHEFVKDLVVAKPLGTVILKGKEVPVHAYEITGLKT